MGIEKLSSSQLKRARSILLGRSGMSVRQLVGFIKDGETPSVADTSELARMVAVPFFCGNCGKPMKSDYDKAVYRLHQYCGMCHAETETLMKVEGNWMDMVDRRRKEAMLKTINDKIEMLQEFAKRDTDIINSVGQTERWSDDNKYFMEKIVANFVDIRDELESELSTESA